MSDFYVSVGDQVSFSKTVGEYDVYGFAGITGDFSGNHVDEEFMRRSVYGRRIAHGRGARHEELLLDVAERLQVEPAVRAGDRRGAERTRAPVDRNRPLDDRFGQH